MLRYILKRLLAGVITIVVLITVAFFMMHAMPGGPFSPDEQKNVPPEILERLAASYGLDKPVFEQYIEYWKGLFHGDLGISFKKTDTTVNSIISTHFPVSARVGAIAVAFSLLIGIPLGVLSAIHRGKAADFATMAFATIGISVPVFVISVILLWLFAQKLQWLPSFGLTTGGITSCRWPASASTPSPTSPARPAPPCWRPWSRITSALPGPRASAS